METISLVSPRVKQELRLEIDEKQINGDLEIVMGDIEKRAAEASCQPHWQLWISSAGTLRDWDWGMTKPSEKSKKFSKCINLSLFIYFGETKLVST